MLFYNFHYFPWWCCAIASETDDCRKEKCLVNKIEILSKVLPSLQQKWHRFYVSLESSLSLKITSNVVTLWRWARLENFLHFNQGETISVTWSKDPFLFWDKKLHEKLFLKFGSKEQSHHNSKTDENIQSVRERKNHSIESFSRFV